MNNIGSPSRNPQKYRNTSAPNKKSINNTSFFDAKKGTSSEVLFPWTRVPQHSRPGDSV